MATLAEYSRDGSVLVIPQLDGLWVSHPHAPKPLLLPMSLCNFATVSPDGRWAAAASMGANLQTKVWELPQGREVFHRTNVNPALAFTRDGRWLVMTWRDFHECLEVGTWRPVAHVPAEQGALYTLAPRADSRYVALQHVRGQIQLCELPTFRPLLTLDAATEWLECSSPDGALLLTRRSGGQFCLWDLRRIREELTPLGLGW
jgi:hypothetical protein